MGHHLGGWGITWEGGGGEGGASPGRVGHHLGGWGITWEGGGGEGGASPGRVGHHLGGWRWGGWGATVHTHLLYIASTSNHCQY